MDFEKQFEEKMTSLVQSEDPAHDLEHFKRVVACAKKLAVSEMAELKVVVPAAWLHDFVIVEKSSPLRAQASRISAEKAVEFLKSISYPEEFLADIAHAIEAHSFSAGVKPLTLEAQIVQDADRLDALGAIGVARCFAVAGQLGRAFYSAQDPFCADRLPDDAIYTIDHFYKKLFRLGESMQTVAGKNEAAVRTAYMQSFLLQLKSEVDYLPSLRP